MSIDYLYNGGGTGFLRGGGLNLGDLLCSPGRYFDLSAEARTLIIGGGVQSAYVLGHRTVPDGYAKSVVWAGGLTKRPEARISATVPGLDAWTIRDRNCVEDEANWLPCVSCMHPMIDAALDADCSGTLLYVNADPKIYSLRNLLASRRLAKERGIDFTTNRAPEHHFYSKWLRSAHVVTNSYHGAYWSLLAGKTVALFGYNFKFQSLLDMFELVANPIPFTKGDQRSLMQATLKALDSDVQLRLERADQLLSDFRNRQLAYALHLAHSGIITSHSVLPPPRLRSEERFWERREDGRIAREYLARGTRDALRLLSRGTTWLLRRTKQTLMSKSD